MSNIYVFIINARHNQSYLKLNLTIVKDSLQQQIQSSNANHHVS
jgi:hypothetical protein